MLEGLIAVLIVVLIALLVEARLGSRDHRTPEERVIQADEARLRHELTAMLLFERQHELSKRGVIELRNGVFHLVARDKPPKKKATRKRKNAP